MDKKQISWIEDHIDSNGIHHIHNVFPDQFAAYYKIHLPYAICDSFPVDQYVSEPDTVEQINQRIAIGKDFFEADQWEKIKTKLLRPIFFREVANQLSLDYDSSFSLRKVIRKLGKTPIHLQRHLPFELEFLGQLVETLGSTKATQFYIHGDHHFEQIDAQYARHYLQISPLNQLLSLYQELNMAQVVPFVLLPHYLLDQQKQWCIAAGKIKGGHYLLLAVDEYFKQQVQQQSWSLLPLKYADRYI